MVGRSMSDVTVYKSICKILVCIVLVLYIYIYYSIFIVLATAPPPSSPYPDAYRSMLFHSVCLRSILILSSYPPLGLSWGLCSSGCPIKTQRAFPFCMVCATFPTNLVRLDLICVCTDLAQDRNSLRAVPNSVTNFRAA